MAAIIKALDSHVPTRVGKNGHSEHTWAQSVNVQESIVQLNTQCVRKGDVDTLSNVLRNILKVLSVEKKDVAENANRVEMLSLLYALIGQTRDITDGKGEYTLSYMMVLTWYEFFPELAEFAISMFVILITDETNTHPYGSWKDIKYLCEYVKTKTGNANHPLILKSIQLMNEQLRVDTLSTSTVSLAGKWAARQGGSKFGWLFIISAEQYFHQYIESANRQPLEKRVESVKRATLKARTEYRKLCSALNKRLDTVQIKQCANIWADIDHSKTTSITISKQKKALMNVNKNGEQHSTRDDRIQCAQNFKSYIDGLSKEGKEVKGARVSFVDFTKSGLDIILRMPSRDNYVDSSTQMQMDILNSQWRDNGKQTKTLGNMIAMVDTSGSMSGDPLNVAISLGIRIAEKSAIGKRIMTFTSTPSWVSLDGRNTFIDMLKVVSSAEWGGNTNFYAALDLILNVIRSSYTITKSECEDMVLVILSDMEVNSGDPNYVSTNLHSGIESRYAKVGMDKFGEPIKPPHILFWNLRSTSGFPTLSNQPNVSTMSGFSPALLNIFCEKGMEALQSCTPWGLLKESLEHPRYKMMCDKCIDVVLPK